MPQPFCHCALFWSILLGGCSLVDSTEPVAFSRELPYAGPHDYAARYVGMQVFADSAAWAVFYRVHGRFGQEGQPGEVPPAPADFTQWDIVAVYYPQASGCSNRVEAIRMVERRGDEVVVEVGRPPSAGYICDMVILPYDMARMDKQRGPVRFVGELPTRLGA